MKMKSLIAALLFTISSLCAAAEFNVKMARWSKGPHGMFIAFTTDAEVRINPANTAVAKELNEIVAQATEEDRHVKFIIEGAVLSDETTYHWRTGYYRVITLNAHTVK